MKKMILVFCFFVSMGAQAAIWKVNDDHSEVLFKVPYLGVSEVTGRFARFSGELELDDKGQAQKLAISIDASTVDTGHVQRDGHLRAQDFLFTEKHPQIVFTSQSIKNISPHLLKVTGQLSLKDHVRPLTLEILLSEIQIDSWNHQNRFAKFQFAIKRSDFGIHWNKTLAGDKFLVGNEITVWGNLQLQPAGKATASSKHMIPDTKSIRHRERLNRGEISKTEYEAATHVSADVDFATRSEVVQKAPSMMPEIQIIQKDVRQTTTWQLWFWGLGLMGFLGALVLGLSAKKWVMDKYPELYVENGWMGHLSDFLSIGLTFIYAVAFWVVGWGT